MMWQSHVIQATLTVEATLQQGVLPFTIPQDSSDTGVSTAKGTLFGWQNNGHLKLMDVGGHSRPPKKKDRQVPTLKRTTVKETGTISEEPLILRGYVSFSGSIVNCHWLYFIRTCLDYVDTPLKKIPGTSRERSVERNCHFGVPGRYPKMQK